MRGRRPPRPWCAELLWHDIVEHGSAGDSIDTANFVRLSLVRQIPTKCLSPDENLMLKPYVFSNPRSIPMKRYLEMLVSSADNTEAYSYAPKDGDNVLGGIKFYFTVTRHCIKLYNMV